MVFASLPSPWGATDFLHSARVAACEARTSPHCISCTPPALVSRWRALPQRFLPAQFARLCNAFHRWVVEPVWAGAACMCVCSISTEPGRMLFRAWSRGLVGGSVACMQKGAKVVHACASAGALGMATTVTDGFMFMREVWHKRLHATSWLVPARSQHCHASFAAASALSSAGSTSSMDTTCSRSTSCAARRW